MRRLFLLILLATACSASGRPGAALIENADPRVTVITTQELRGRSIVDAIRLRVPDVRIELHDGACAHIALPTARSLPATREATIFVDGNAARDACVFDTLLPGTVDRVEVYPGGVPAKTGYPRNDHGMVLVFTRVGRGATRQRGFAE